MDLFDERLSEILMNGFYDDVLWDGLLCGSVVLCCREFFWLVVDTVVIVMLGLGAMGFGLPSALGAAATNPDVPVVDIDGDGSFLMNIQVLSLGPRCLHQFFH